MGGANRVSFPSLLGKLRWAVRTGYHFPLCWVSSDGEALDGERGTCGRMVCARSGGREEREQAAEVS